MDMLSGTLTVCGGGSGGVLGVVVISCVYVCMYVNVEVVSCSGRVLLMWKYKNSGDMGMWMRMNI